MRFSVASRRSSSSRAMTARPNSVSATSASAGPRHSPSARRRVAAAAAGSVAQLGPARGGQFLEPDDVGGPRVELELVAGRPGFDHRLGQRAAQPGHQGLQRVRGPGRRLIGPEPVDELAGRDQLAGAQRQHDQQRAQPGPADLEYFSRGGADLKRTEHRDLHVLNSARLAGDSGYLRQRATRRSLPGGRGRRSSWTRNLRRARRGCRPA